jgi:glutathione synthase/RimK-type ligase-like ATP-grasp enzyme
VILTDHEGIQGVGQAVDGALYAALKTRGIAVQEVDWRAVAPESVCSESLVVIRTTWDYIDYHQQFLEFTSRIPDHLLCNPASVVAWNSHKSYLLDLESDGVKIIPTFLRRSGQACELAKLLQEKGWQHAVVKPAVSAGSKRTVLVHAPDELGSGQDLLDTYVDEDFLVQPYIPSVLQKGELSLVFVEGVLSHAFRKMPPPGTFSMLAASLSAVTATPQEHALGVAALQSVLRKCPTAGKSLLIARVDIANDADGTPLLMELELIEPCLFFGVAPDAADLLAEAIAVRASAGSKE